ncbi:PTS sugar transporter subunit IIA [Collinsella sp. AGMB00827]|uniref:PTS sugar transporter subunit IIA n=1 Tax=Collinsella ureilytica TaxID=2869515 RepID=A0ABS7MK62_9ACTN|nr:PTS sugar transporter subunit IIA [Collinsella urealyticum]MBY4797761.1 PTS sugar transporter subunit IIA [Collinsella urealyticum]
MSLKLPLEDVLLNVKAESYEEALRIASSHLFKAGKVKQSYAESLLMREREYPTGLKMGNFNVAIPHTDYLHANTTQILVMTLNPQVSWHNMADAEEAIPVRLVVLSVFDKPEYQLEALQKIIGTLQNQTLVKQIISASNAQQVIEFFN